MRERILSDVYERLGLERVESEVREEESPERQRSVEPAEQIL